MKIYWYGKIDSTQKIARQLIKKGVERGSIVVADSQIKGRGRLNRTWMSPLGGLYCSIIIESDSFLPVRVAVAVATTLSSTGIDATIKWPNDIMVVDKKIAGILIETSGQNAIVGIGVNINNTPLDTATSLIQEGLQVSRNKLLTDLYQNLMDTLRAPRKTIRNTYRRCSHTLGKQVTIKLNDEKVTGIATDIDVDGGLLVKSDNQVKKIIAGDCIYLQS
jgi:BirA family biotin operon repressor/biotin-[acetyl-CoA-carboxylase] ligase